MQNTTEDSKCSKKRSRTIQFLNPCEATTKMVKSGAYVIKMLTICTTMNDSCLVQLFSLRNSLSKSTVAKEAIADPLPKYLLQCSPVQTFQVFEGGCH